MRVPPHALRFVARGQWCYFLAAILVLAAILLALLTDGRIGPACITSACDQSPPEQIPLTRSSPPQRKGVMPGEKPNHNDHGNDNPPGLAGR